MTHKVSVENVCKKVEKFLKNVQENCQMSTIL